jgi:hypothetical protein
MSDPAFIVLCKEIDDVDIGVGVELRYYGSCPQSYLKPLAEAALSEGFDLMFEFDSPPDMEAVQSRAMVGQVSSMKSMVRLWVLNQEKIDA